ncbi:SDR family NAD(P)-dependent oxidoreductase [Nocardioides alcanivorans]|uniref:SDR family NAD(P)-dependent oxidoreductase n=1 Tax=Nocardioides alcanivorans TaxID=2897352 RepID=UPI001F27012B|nr:SDR family NAD(P)-dependent oxidoreductase [Nocardioides alcanivorans]
MTVDLGDQSGRTFVVTGATSGLGRETALALAGAGARVVLAARSAERIATTRTAIERRVPQARLEQLIVDLADLSSVRHAAGHAVRLGPVDVLVNNAGVMATPTPAPWTASSCRWPRTTSAPSS